jgi:hypothetical protein
VRRVLACLAAPAICIPLAAGETFQADVSERKVAALPHGPAVDGPLPRPLLVVKLEERGEFVGDRTVSSFWVFDPAAPEKGLRKIFSGPGQDQLLRFITPLFGGWGVASGRLDREKEPEREGPWFWFNPMEGKAGPNIDVDMWARWIDGGWFVGEQMKDDKDGGTLRRVIRYDPLKALVRTTELDFTYINWLDKSTILGVAMLKEGERIVRMDVGKSAYEIIGRPPPGSDPRSNRMSGFEVSAAGGNCRDGIFASGGFFDDFSLWFLPNGGEWHPVIRNVHIVKTFGGKFPWLPVSYVGNCRFAVTKTVKDEVEVPKTTPREDAIFGAAEAVTMLIDGVTGKVLKQSEPFIYNHNPPLKIPDDWWAAGMKPEAPAAPVKAASLFDWNEAKREIHFAGGKVVKLGEDDERDESGDGRFLAIYQKCPHGGGKAETVVPLRILDGKTGQVHSAEVRSGFYEVWVDVSWEVLCAESPDAETLKDFQDTGPR